MASFHLNFFLLAVVVLPWMYQGQTMGCEVSLLVLNETEHGIVLEQDNFGALKLKEPVGGMFVWADNEQIIIGCGNETRFAMCNNFTENIICDKAPKTTFRSISTTTGSCPGTEFEVGFEINNSNIKKKKSSVGNSAKKSSAPLPKQATRITTKKSTRIKTKRSTPNQTNRIPMFIPYYYICYDTVDCSVIYTRHQLLGHAFAVTNRVPRAAGKPFKKFACESLSYNHFYLQDTQRNHSRLSITGQNYLQRGHLFPDRDAPVHSWKMATYYYGNCAPQWNTINSGGGNWHKLEGMVLNTSIVNGERYEIYDGVLYEEDQIYLGDGKIKVPSWYWKIVTHDRQKGMIFFVYNNPYQSSNRVFCMNGVDQCADYNWKFNNTAQEKGTTRCCVPNNLRPGILPVSDGLQNINTALRFNFVDLDNGADDRKR